MDNKRNVDGPILGDTFVAFHIELPPLKYLTIVQTFHNNDQLLHSHLKQPVYKYFK